MTHVSQFRKPGDYLTLPVGGYSIFLTLGKDQKLRGFHNVCRHRAYEVTRKECGSTLIFGCKYHGWSYNTEGTLVKAPEFDAIDGFKKEDNGLWEIGVTVAKSGAVWVCLDTAREDGSPGPCVDDTGLQAWGFKTASKVSEHKIEGSFNWKLACEYILSHASLANPDKPSRVRISSSHGHSERPFAAWKSDGVVQPRRY